VRDDHIGQRQVGVKAESFQIRSCARCLPERRNPSPRILPSVSDCPHQIPSRGSRHRSLIDDAIQHHDIDTSLEMARRRRSGAATARVKARGFVEVFHGPDGPKGFLQLLRLNGEHPIGVMSTKYPAMQLILVCCHFLKRTGPFQKTVMAGLSNRTAGRPKPSATFASTCRPKELPHSGQ